MTIANLVIMIMLLIVCFFILLQLTAIRKNKETMATHLQEKSNTEQKETVQMPVIVNRFRHYAAIVERFKNAGVPSPTDYILGKSLSCIVWTGIDRSGKEYQISANFTNPEKIFFVIDLDGKVDRSYWNTFDIEIPAFINLIPENKENLWDTIINRLVDQANELDKKGSLNPTMITTEKDSLTADERVELEELRRYKRSLIETEAELHAEVIKLREEVNGPDNVPWSLIAASLRQDMTHIKTAIRLLTQHKCVKTGCKTIKDDTAMIVYSDLKNALEPYLKNK